MKPIQPFLVLAAALGLASAGAAWSQAGSGNLYRVTSKVEMAGMPFSMPASTVEVCGPKEQASDKMVPHDENCTVSNFRVVGNTSSFDMACRGDNAMTGRGEFERLGPDAYRGRMQMQGKMEGQSVDMTMQFEGKKIRDCNYATESPQAQGQAMMAKTCEDLLRQPSPLAFQSFAGADAVCASYKPRYCSAMLAQSVNPAFIRTNDDMLRQSPGLTSFWDAFAACGTPRPAALAKACPMAEKSRDYPFLTEYCPNLVAKACASADPRTEAEFVVASCPAQAQAAAAAHCAGRDYTAMRASPYANFCGRYAGGQLQQRNAGAASPVPAATPATPAAGDAPKKPSWRDRLRDAKDKLTGED
ncbi:MAG TPA: DUF3617 family protein [Arenimonas sp.]|uniref:DUF3617 domain-containing protein n=1 Tax=Arenimonas sp. TaxID=1872635 RepID=UPI002D7E4A3A|nr:DUF3617 family protein [Arenimonas sp.]HEU0152932.1 DUF3617 family protein [Arenimonas sp.]